MLLHFICTSNKIEASEKILSYGNIKLFAFSKTRFQVCSQCCSINSSAGKSDGGDRENRIGQRDLTLHWTAICICPNCKMYLSKFLNVFVQTVKCICQNSQINLSKLSKVFVQIVISICGWIGQRQLSLHWTKLDRNLYLSKLQKVFFQTEKCICQNC